MNGNSVVLKTEDLKKELRVGEVTIQALRGVSMSVDRGEFLGIIGPSGSGKSTLLGLIGGLDSPTSGKVYIDSEDITNLGERELTRVRNEKIGFVFQFFNLIPTLTALENVSLPIQFARQRKFDANKRAKELLDLLGVGDRLHHRPTQLSGGQQQRVAIARALANGPSLLLCDEPTGSLDTTASETVMKALRDVQKSMNTTVIIVTHNMDIAAQMERLITLVDGHIATDVEVNASQHAAATEAIRQKRQTGELRLSQS
ncbi:MAG: ABC transporter ATP-binding protein [Anaerolineae bacterium]|nr:ABC transporter ATP-binding protein [Anaerolineae bacterium]